MRAVVPDQPLYLMVTPSNINDITAARQMPIEAEATYVFDLGLSRWAVRPGMTFRHFPCSSRILAWILAMPEIQRS